MPHICTSTSATVAMASAINLPTASAKRSVEDVVKRTTELMNATQENPTVLTAKETMKHGALTVKRRQKKVGTFIR